MELSIQYTKTLKGFDEVLDILQGRDIMNAHIDRSTGQFRIVISEGEYITLSDDGLKISKSRAENLLLRELKKPDQNFTP
jgi:hypothetical protein